MMPISHFRFSFVGISFADAVMLFLVFGRVLSEVLLQVRARDPLSIVAFVLMGYGIFPSTSTGFN